LTSWLVCDIFHNIVKNFTINPKGSKPQVVIVGGGFGGLAAAERLANAAVEITLVDAHNRFTFQPLLYQVATAALDPDEIAYPLRSALGARPNVRFRMARVRGVDWDNREVQLDGQAALRFDYLIVAAGAVTHDFGIPGVREHAHGLKTLEDALALRNHILATFERADGVVQPGAGSLAFAVVGGGPIGVEIAGALRELISDALVRDFPSLDPADMRVTLIDGQDRILPAYDASLSAAALSALRDKGVEVLLGRSVAEVTADGVRLSDGGLVPARTVIWGAGIAAHPLARALDVELTRGGRVVVDADLSIPAHPDAFVVGDMAASPDGAGGLLPQMAQPAMQGGAHAAGQVLRRIAGKPSKPFAYRDYGIMATIGRNAAVVQLPNGMRFSGFVAWLMWVALHLLRLMGFRNRVNVFVNWVGNYFANTYGGRIVVGAQTGDSPSHPRSARQSRTVVDGALGVE
jgi:NADH:ubiquinone reductase (H+-translocating)